MSLSDRQKCDVESWESTFLSNYLVAMPVEIINARSEPTVGGPPSYHAVQSRRYNKSAETNAKQNAFLKAYSRHGTVTHAARDAGVHVSYHYNWLDVDPEYPAKFKLAHQEAVEALEREARRRAIEGVDEPSGWYKGEPGGFVKKYSDTLLIFLLKGALPDKYKDRHEHTGKNGGPIEVQSTVTIEQFPTWLKQAIVVVSSGVMIDPEVEQVLMQHFEAKFLEAEKLVGGGTTNQLTANQPQFEPVEMISESVVEAEQVNQVEQVVTIDPVLESEMEPTEPSPSRDWRPAKRASLDMDDI